MTNTSPKGTSDEHYTPKQLFIDLGVNFDLDVASPHLQPNSLANKWFCKCCHDGLTLEWNGNVWMNPPYSGPAPWVEKFIQHGLGIALLPTTRGKWWDSIWNAADAVLPLAYNYKFERPDGLPMKPIVFRTSLYALGEKNVEALKRLQGKMR